MSREKQIKSSDWLTEGYSKEELARIKDKAIEEAVAELREKQIEEMAKALTRYEYSLCERLPKDKCLLTSAVHAQVSCDYCKIAEFLVNEGYRKDSDVAREIIKNLVKFADDKERQSIINGHSVWFIDADDLTDFIAELKKKYTEGKE